jgi:cell shape-determining protein MreC
MDKNADTGLRAWIQKYHLWIIIVLAVLLFFKSCQSCSRKQTTLFSAVQNRTVTDSLNGLLRTQDDTIIYYINKTKMLEAENRSLQSENAGLQNDKEFLKKEASHHDRR